MLHHGVPVPSINPCFFEVESVAKNIKGSKKKLTWNVELDGFDYTVDVTVSYLTGKRRVYANRELLYTDRTIFSKNFLFSWEDRRHFFSIRYNKEKKKIWLSIDGEEFNIAPVVSFASPTRSTDTTASYRGDILNAAGVDDEKKDHSLNKNILSPPKSSEGGMFWLGSSQASPMKK